MKLLKIFTILFFTGYMCFIHITPIVLAQTTNACDAMDDALLGERLGSDPNINMSTRLSKLKAKDESSSGTFLKVTYPTQASPTDLQTKVKNFIDSRSDKNANIVTSVNDIVTYGKTYNIHPLFAVSVWAMETSLGSKMKNNNIGNIRDGSNFKQYTTLNDAIKDWFITTKREYIDHTSDTVEEIIIQYAPCTDSNNPLAYINFVYKTMTGSEKYDGKTSASSSSSTTSGPLESNSTNGAIALQAPLPIGDIGTQVEDSNASYFFVYILKIYRWVAGIAGAFAVLMVMFGGFQVAMARGDTGMADEGRKRILQAVTGLVLLFVSSILLRTINPNFFTFDTETGVVAGSSEEDAQNYASLPKPADGDWNSPDLIKHQLTVFTGSNFIGDKVEVDIAFVPFLQKIDTFLGENNMKLNITSSYRKTKVDGIVTGGKMSNHMVGQAIDYNLQRSNGTNCNSSCLPKDPEHAKFIDFVKSLGLRYGGDWKTPDPVHIDTGLNLANPSLWQDIRKQLAGQ